MPTLDIKTRFAILLGCFALGFAIYGAWSIKILQEVRVNGPIYDRIVQSKDLVADVLPPPEYIIESYLVAYELLAAHGKAEQDQLLQRMQALRADYDQRHKFWQQQGLETDLQQALLRDAHASATDFYSVFQNDFIPAIGKRDMEAAAAVMQRLRAHYSKHRKAIDRVVQLANQRSAADEAAARDRIASAGWQLPAILLLALAAGVGVAVQILRKLFHQLGGDPAAAASLASRIAGGDLTVGICLRPGDDSSLLHAMQGMRDNLAKIVRQARGATEAISSASSQIASGNQDLAVRTSAQAGSLEQTTASMQGLTTTVARNADQAHEANLLADSAATTARRGGDVVSQVVQTMSSISTSSRRIADIIGVIDGIAFQTNILALNAAVEAARAGEQGRGFAVVASEVRTLAQRSAVAAKEIKELIGDSVRQVDAGSELAGRAGNTMQEVVASIERVAGIMDEITLASRQQSGSITQVHDALSQMDAATQQNATLVEEAAAAAESMHTQTGELVRVVSVFQLEEARTADPRLLRDMPRLRTA